MKACSVNFVSALGPVGDVIRREVHSEKRSVHDVAWTWPWTWQWTR